MIRENKNPLDLLRSLWKYLSFESKTSQNTNPEQSSHSQILSVLATNTPKGQKRDHSGSFKCIFTFKTQKARQTITNFMRQPMEVFTQPLPKPQLMQVCQLRNFENMGIGSQKRRRTKILVRGCVAKSVLEREERDQEKMGQREHTGREESSEQ